MDNVGLVLRGRVYKMLPHKIEKKHHDSTIHEKIFWSSEYCSSPSSKV